VFSGKTPLDPRCAITSGRFGIALHFAVSTVGEISNQITTNRNTFNAISTICDGKVFSRLTTRLNVPSLTDSLVVESIFSLSAGVENKHVTSNGPIERTIISGSLHNMLHEKQKAYKLI